MAQGYKKTYNTSDEQEDGHGPYVLVLHNLGKTHPLVAVYRELPSGAELMPTPPRVRVINDNKVHVYTNTLGSNWRITVRIAV